LVVVAFVVGLIYLKDANVGASAVDDVDAQTSAESSPSNEQKAAQTDSQADTQTDSQTNSRAVSPGNKAESSQADTGEADTTTDLPVLGKEQYDYVNELREYSVEVDVEEMPESNNTYFLQCGSFRTQERADVLKANIALKGGLESLVQKRSGTNGTWYRVVVGPYQRGRKADFDRNNLRKKGVVGCTRIREWNQ
jgi:cell division protein FtsN